MKGKVSWFFFPSKWIRDRMNFIVRENRCDSMWAIVLSQCDQSDRDKLCLCSILHPRWWWSIPANLIVLSKSFKQIRILSIHFLRHFFSIVQVRKNAFHFINVVMVIAIAMRTKMRVNCQKSALLIPRPNHFVVRRVINALLMMIYANNITDCLQGEDENDIICGHFCEWPSFKYVFEYEENRLDDRRETFFFREIPESMFQCGILLWWQMRLDQSSLWWASLLLYVSKSANETISIWSESSF